MFHFNAEAKKKKKESEDVKEAKEHFKNGVSMFEKEDFSGALEEFKTSFSLRPMWSVRYNIGLCYLRLGYQAEAATELSLYLDEGGDHVKSATAQEVNTMLMDLLPELGTIVLFGNLQGIALEVDGKPKDGPTSKGEVFVRHGSMEFVVYRGKQIILQEEMNIEKGEIIELDLPKQGLVLAKEIEEDPGDESEGDPTLNTTGSPTGNEGGSTAAGDGKKEKKKTSVKRMWLWIAVGITGATLAGGATMGFLAVKERNDMRSDEDKYRLLKNTAPQDQLQGILKSRNDHYTKGKIFSTTATVLLSVGAAGGVASIILLVLSGKKAKVKEKQEKTSVFFMPQPAGGMLTILY